VIDPGDERTAFSKRSRPGADHDDVPDDRTLPARGVRDAAAVAPPRRSSALPPGIDDTAVSDRSAAPADSELTTQAATASAPAGPRRSAHPPAPASEEGARRTASSGPVTPATPSSPSGRIAAPPETVTAYRARPVPEAAAARSGSSPRIPQRYVDTTAAEGARRRRRRRRTIVVAVAASVLLIAAAVALALLLTSG